MTPKYLGATSSVIKEHMSILCLRTIFSKYQIENIPNAWIQARWVLGYSAVGNRAMLMEASRAWNPECSLHFGFFLGKNSPSVKSVTQLKTQCATARHQCRCSAFQNIVETKLGLWNPGVFRTFMNFFEHFPFLMQVKVLSLNGFDPK